MFSKRVESAADPGVLFASHSGYSMAILQVSDRRLADESVRLGFVNDFFQCLLADLVSWRWAGDGLELNVWQMKRVVGSGDSEGHCAEPEDCNDDELESELDGSKVNWTGL